MFMHKSCLLVCHPYFNTMKLWTPNLKLHLSLLNTTFCLLAMLLVCHIACLLASLFLCLPYLPCLSASCLYHVLFVSFPSIACLLVSCLCLCMYTHGARMYGARAWFPKHKQKGRGCEHVNIRPTVVFKTFRGLDFPIWLCTLLNPLPSSTLSLLDGLY